ncbi:MAG TPA: S8 family serine peptidase [Pseudogracilibacillus sp.]|nr:S8 family serine peptidase [Pseudogracilibacillus sp.]
MKKVTGYCIIICTILLNTVGVASDTVQNADNHVWQQSPATAADNERKESPFEKLKERVAVIIEVEDDAEKTAELIKSEYPTVDIVSTYTILFQALAIEGPPDKIKQITQENFTRGTHPVVTYTVPNELLKIKPLETSTFSHKTAVKSNTNIVDLDKTAQAPRTGATDANKAAQTPSTSAVDANKAAQTPSTSAVDANKTAQAPSGHTPNINITAQKPGVNRTNIIDHARYYIPAQLNDTNYTGKNVKIGVIDTGIDITHPDLQKNYKGGYDVVDLDDEPNETKEGEGIPTSHGTHVAGIIAADGKLQGVAPDAEIYAYRALGPGGVGTSIHVIAAIEEAIKDGVDIINLSLGNTINGPDYPTSKAVNETVTTHDVAVVVANGNAGPKDWTVGAPATALHALSVGAYEPETTAPYLYDRATDKEIALSQPTFAKKWDLTRDYTIVDATETDNVRGTIALLPLNEQLTEKRLEKTIQNGAVALIIAGTITNNEEQIALLENFNIPVPVAFISERDKRWLKKQINAEPKYFDTKQKPSGDTIAPFSSRGPVAVNWTLKPDIIAPGVQVASTIPNGYAAFNGTSMAAPHISGAIAILKEAHPTWSNEQIIGALKTTTKRLQRRDQSNIPPSTQGTGLVQINEAINTKTILHDTQLTFGKYDEHITTKEETMTIENMSNERQTYSFHIPKKTKGLTWHVPQTVTVDPGERKEIPVTLKVNTLLAKQGVREGWLTLERNDGQTYEIPYMFIAQTAAYPKLMGFTFRLHDYDEKLYQYEMYVAEDVKSLEVQLYDEQSLVYKGKLTEWKNLEQGLHKGEIRKDAITQRGHFYALIIVQLENGDYINYDTNITLK